MSLEELLGDKKHDKAKSSSPQKKDAEGPAHLTVPTDLGNYLPPSLWRKLSGGRPHRKLLIQTLDRLRSLLYLLSTFLPNHLVQEKMQRPIPGLVSGKTLRGSLLFADVSGFTALSERLAVLGLEGAEHLTEIMNNYFETMLEILSWSGGILLKFAGDATLVYFPEQRKGRQAQWAVRAGFRMLRAVSAFSNIETPHETVTLQMKIGVATGEFLAASIGSVERMEYAILGEAVSQTMASEGAATGAGQLIVNAATVEHLNGLFFVREQIPGFYSLEQREEHELGDFEIRAEKRRARGAVPLDADPRTILAQIESTLDQIRSLRPYFAPELVERIIAHAQQRSFESEFRLTVVMFCNFVGPERLMEHWGSQGTQKVTSLLSAYFNAMSDVITRYGGIISRIDPYSKGTKLLALFGAPVSHQDDPLRAVRAASLMDVELQFLNDRWSQKLARHLPKDFKGPLIQHRIGITEGDTFAGEVGSSTRREYTVMGDDVNLAARLMGAAKPGQILLSQPVYDEVADFFFLTPLAPIKVKGKTQPIPIYLVDGPRNDTLLNRVRQRSRLIGQDEALLQGQDLLRKALSGTCTALTIQGPAGSGKSHLADTLLKEALFSKARVLSYQCNSYNASIPYASWSGLLRSLVRITSTDPTVLQQEKLYRLLSDLELSKSVGKPLGTLMGLKFSEQHGGSRLNQGEDESNLFDDLVNQKGVRRRSRGSDLLAQLEEKGSSRTSQTGFYALGKNSQGDREQLMGAVSDVLAALLGKSPLVIFFEDAHWLDTASRELLSSLQETLGARSLFIILAQRGIGDRTSIGQILKLEPLDPAGTNELVADILLSDLTKLIHQQSNGNPLFINEITHWVRQIWAISLTDIEKALQTSDFLRNLVFSNLENLPESQREIIRISSVVGDEFRVSALQALLPSSVDSVSLYNDLRDLVEARFISLAEAGVDPCYTFQQKLVRDILYNSLPFARRRELHAKLAAHLSAPPSRRSGIHAKIALFLDAAAVSNPAQDAAIIAQHFEAAEKWHLAANHFLQAAGHAREHKHYEEATDYYQRALAGLEKLSHEKSGPEIVSLQQILFIGQGDMALLNENYTQAKIAYQKALDVNLEAEHSVELVTLKVKLALVLPTQDQANEAESILRHILVDGGNQDLKAMTTLVWLLWRKGDPEAHEWIEKCQGLLSTISSESKASIEILLNDLKGNWETVTSTYRTIDQPVGAALASVRQGDKCLRNGDVTKAQRYYQKAAHIWDKQLEDDCGLALAHYRMAEVYWHLQDAEAAREELDAIQNLLASCPMAIRREAQALIVKALEIINTSASGAWPEWRWQIYDDAFRINLLFHSNL